MYPHIKVSVIIPVYNVEKYLSECLDSLLTQTLEEIEIICVDDGSTDSSPKILDAYAEKDSRIIVIHQKNSGAGAARNRGISYARGEYIGFVDSDDIAFHTMYEELYRKAVSCQADMVITGDISTATGNKLQFPIENFDKSSRIMELGYFNAVDCPDILKNVFLWNRIYKRSFWLENKFIIPEGRRFAEDLLICTQTSVLAKKIGYVRGPLYWYRNERDNSMSDTLKKSSCKMDYILAVHETKAFLVSTGMYPLYQQNFLVFSMHLFCMLQSTIANYAHFYEFYSGIAKILDDQDLDILDKTWIKEAYPRVLRAIHRKSYRSLYWRNRVLSVLH